MVTGAAGFMGSHVVEYLASKGEKVRATARPRQDTSFFDNLGVEFVPADLTKADTLPQLFEGGVDRVMHLGAICNFSTPYEKLAPTNVSGVERITNLALAAGVRSFVHVTSTSVYGLYPGTPFTEETPRNPKDSYGRSKRDGEDVVWRQVKNGLPAVILRPCTVYGPRCRDGAGKVFSRPSSIPAIPGDGKQLLANIRAEDVALAMDHLSRRTESFGQAYNISDDSNPTLQEALTWSAEVYGQKAPSMHLPLGLMKVMSRVDGFFSGLRGRLPELEYEAVGYLYHDYVVSNQKLKDTGFSLKYPDFHESLRELGRLWQSGQA